MSKDLNLPDNCQGNDPSYPWNEPEEIFCPNCGGETSMIGDELHCNDEGCGYSEEQADYEGDY